VAGLAEHVRHPELIEGLIADDPLVSSLRHFLLLLQQWL